MALRYYLSNKWAMHMRRITLKRSRPTIAPYCVQIKTKRKIYTLCMRK